MQGLVRPRGRCAGNTSPLASLSAGTPSRPHSPPPRHAARLHGALLEALYPQRALAGANSAREAAPATATMEDRGRRTRDLLSSTARPRETVKTSGSDGSRWEDMNQGHLTQAQRVSRKRAVEQLNRWRCACSPCLPAPPRGAHRAPCAPNAPVRGAGVSVKAVPGRGPAGSQSH